MTSNVPIQAPVTGREQNSDQTDWLQALSQFYLALNSRNIDLMEKNWSSSAGAAMDNPLGEIRRGWLEIGLTYKKLFDSESSYRFEFYDYTTHEVGDIFYVVGRERGEFAIKGLHLNLSIRTTRIFRRNQDRKWLQVHHHGSIDQPETLAAYQKAVLGNPVS